MTDISGQRSDEIMILKKGGMQLDVSLLVFYTRLPLPETAYLSEIVIRVPVVCGVASSQRYNYPLILNI